MIFSYALKYNGLALFFDPISYCAKFNTKSTESSRPQFINWFSLTPSIIKETIVT